MRILRSDDIAIGHADRVFRQSPAAGLFAAVAFLAAGIAIGAAVWFGVVPSPVGGVVVALLLLFGSIAFATYRRTTTSDNWLLVSDGSRLLIKLRSHLNRDRPDDSSHVLELDRSDIAGFRVTRSTITGDGPSGDRDGGVTVFLDLLVKSPTEELTAALSEERERRIEGAVWRHYPVTLPQPDTVRLEWRGRYARIIPPIDEAVRLLATIATPLAPQAESVDLGTAGRAPLTSTVERDIRLLAEQGRVIDATALAVRGLGMKVPDARRFVESLSARRIAPPRE